MPRNDLNVALKGLDDLFSSEETRQEEQREQVQQIPVSELFPFKNHPFKVLDDDAMTRTVESISQFGVLAPLIARPRPEGGYEIISGHRRKHAAELAHLDTVPVIVRNMEDDAATILVDSVEQRHSAMSIYEAILSLPPKQAKRCYDHYYQGFKLSDIAQKEGVTAGSVSECIKSALSTLRERCNFFNFCD